MVLDPSSAFSHLRSFSCDYPGWWLVANRGLSDFPEMSQAKAAGPYGLWNIQLKPHCYASCSGPFRSVPTVRSGWVLVGFTVGSLAVPPLPLLPVLV